MGLFNSGKGFDIDLKFGQKGEYYTAELMLGFRKIEIKTERIQSGRVSYEFACRGKLSGLTTSDADAWFNQLIFSKRGIGSWHGFETMQLRRNLLWCVERRVAKLLDGGDRDFDGGPRVSDLILMPVNQMSLLDRPLEDNEDPREIMQRFTAFATARKRPEHIFRRPA